MNALKIGNVVRVESGVVDVVITVNDLNILHDDRTYRVGQLGSYVTIPMDNRTLVGFVTGSGRQEVTTADIEPQLIMHVQLLGESHAGRFVLELMYHPDLPYSDVQPGATFTVREGGRIVGHGVVLSRTEPAAVQW